MDIDWKYTKSLKKKKTINKKLPLEKSQAYKQELMATQALE